MQRVFSRGITVKEASSPLESQTNQICFCKRRREQVLDAETMTVHFAFSDPPISKVFLRKKPKVN